LFGVFQSALPLASLVGEHRGLVHGRVAPALGVSRGRLVRATHSDCNRSVAARAAISPPSMSPIARLSASTRAAPRRISSSCDRARARQLVQAGFKLALAWDSRSRRLILSRCTSSTRFNALSCHVCVSAPGSLGKGDPPRCGDPRTRRAPWTSPCRAAHQLPTAERSGPGSAASRRRIAPVP